MEEEEEKESVSKMNDEVREVEALETRMNVVVGAGEGSSLEHQSPLHQCLQGQVPAVSERSSRPHRLWRGFFLHQTQLKGTGLY